MLQILYLALKSTISIDPGSLVSGVVISRSPSTLYILCSSSGLLLSHIRIDRVSVPPHKGICSSSSDVSVCFIIVTIPTIIHYCMAGGICVSSN